MSNFDEINFLQGMYTNPLITDIYDKQKKDKDEVLKFIANLMLIYLISNNIMKMSYKDRMNSFSKANKLIDGLMNNEVKTEIENLTNTLNYLATQKSVNIDKKSFNKILNRTIKGKTYSDRTWDNKNKTAKILKKRVKDFIDGKTSVNDITEEIVNAFKVDENESKRLVENEISRVNAELNEEYFKKNDIKKVKYIAKLDNTCKVCFSRDGKIYDVNDKNRPKLPAHVNCKCFYAIVEVNADKLQENANRSFEVSKKDKTYNRRQKEESQLNESNSEKQMQLESKYNSISAKGVSQAKSRNRKIDITDIAIDKVPNIKIPGFTQEQNLMVQQKHKELLKISKDENNCNEVLNICTINFNKGAITLGEETGVNPNKNPEAVSVMRVAEENSIIWMHNHPKGSTFSLGDIITFISDRRINTITVVSNTGKVYSLSKTKGFNYSFIRDKILEMKDHYELDKEDDETHNKIVGELLKFLNKNGAIYKKR